MINNDLKATVPEISELDDKSVVLNICVDSDKLDDWLCLNIKDLRNRFKQNGLLLIRGMSIYGSKKLSRVLANIFESDLLDYNFGSTPRTKMRGNIYTSSEYHPDETIPLHNENSYSNRWAMNIAFYCVKAAQVGGATPIGNSRKILASIPSEVVDRFENRKLRYVRNYGTLDLHWSNVFHTQDRGEVEQYCTENNIEFQWIGKDNLRTSQVCSAIAYHPTTKEKLWFNQAHLFHVSGLSQANKENIEKIYRKDELPRNVYFGDGGEIDIMDLQQIRKAYLENMIIFDWQEGDLLLLDNMLYSHGRQPYSGERRVLVGMSKSCCRD